MKRNPGKMIFCFLPLLLAAGFLCLPLLTDAAPAAKISIVVDPGRFATAEKAAFAEAEVDWWDDATADDSACTESYAAVELRNYLCKLTGRKADDGDAFPIVSGRAGSVRVVTTDIGRRDGSSERHSLAGNAGLPDRPT